MITEKNFIEMALAFPGAEQTPHFQRAGFRVKGKAMFCTYLSADNTANIFLTPKEQRLFCRMDKVNIFPVPNKWGEKGATTFNLNEVAKEFVQEALLAAYRKVIKPKK